MTDSTNQQGGGAFVQQATPVIEAYERSLAQFRQAYDRLDRALQGAHFKPNYTTIQGGLNAAAAGLARIRATAQNARRALDSLIAQGAGNLSSEPGFESIRARAAKASNSQEARAAMGPELRREAQAQQIITRMQTIAAHYEGRIQSLPPLPANLDDARQQIRDTGSLLREARWRTLDFAQRQEALDGYLAAADRLLAAPSVRSVLAAMPSYDALSALLTRRIRIGSASYPAADWLEGHPDHKNFRAQTAALASLRNDLVQMLHFGLERCTDQLESLIEPGGAAALAAANTTGAQINNAVSPPVPAHIKNGPAYMKGCFAIARAFQALNANPPAKQAVTIVQSIKTAIGQKLPLSGLEQTLAQFKTAAASMNKLLTVLQAVQPAPAAAPLAASAKTSHDAALDIAAFNTGLIKDWKEALKTPAQPKQVKAHIWRYYAAIFVGLPLLIAATVKATHTGGPPTPSQPYIPKGRAAESFLPVPSSGTVADMAGELKKLGWTFVKAGPVAHKDFVYGAAGADIMDYENGKVTKVGTVLLLSKGESTPLAIRYDTNQVLFYDKTPGSRAIKLFSIIVNPSENKDQTGSIAWFRNLPVTGSLPATFDKPAAPVRKSPARFAKTAHNAG